MAEKLLAEVAARPLAMDRPGVCAAFTVSVCSGDVAVTSVGPPGVSGTTGCVTLAVARLVTLPASRSACVTVSEAVQVKVLPGASPPCGKAGHVTDTRSSVMVIASVRVTLPAFVTT